MERQSGTFHQFINVLGQKLGSKSINIVWFKFHIRKESHKYQVQWNMLIHTTINLI